MNGDQISLEGLVFYGFHGVDPAEKELGQRFVIDIALFLDLAPAGRTDDLNLTVNYADVYREVKAIVEGPSLNLLESVAERIADAILGNHPVQAVRVKVRKPEVPLKGSVLSAAAVEIFRSRAPE